MTQVIIGGGMSGLICANLLKHHKPVVLEAQKSLPNNHSAVLRFRTNRVGEVLGIQFKRVKVLKASLPWRNPVADSLAYAHKCLGIYRSDRSIPERPEEVERWIAPPDLIKRMSENVTIGTGVQYSFSEEEFSRDGKVISTIPMPILMHLLKYPGTIPEFRFNHGVNIRAFVGGCDAYVTLYVPTPGCEFSRITLTGNELILEVPNCTLEDVQGREGIMVDQAVHILGLAPFLVTDVQCVVQKYFKIEPIDEQERKAFVFWASTSQGRAFSLGRFACWRPGLMNDDLINDIYLIDGWIKSGTPGYDQQLHKVGRG